MQSKAILASSAKERWVFFVFVCLFVFENHRPFWSSDSFLSSIQCLWFQCADRPMKTAVSIVLKCLWFLCADKAAPTADCIVSTVFIIWVCRQRHEDCLQFRPRWLPALSLSSPQPGTRFVTVKKPTTTTTTTTTTTVGVKATCFAKMHLIYSIARENCSAYDWIGYIPSRRIRSFSHTRILRGLWPSKNPKTTTTTTTTMTAAAKATCFAKMHLIYSIARGNCSAYDCIGYIPSRRIRSSSHTRTLRIPFVNTKSFGQRRFSFTGPTPNSVVIILL